MKLLRPKKCTCCGKVFNELPVTARKGDESKDEYAGYFFECSCHSTLYVPDCIVDSDDDGIPPVGLAGI